MIASLPMYDWPELGDETSAFWAVLKDALREAGFEAPDALSDGAEGKHHWLQPDMIFSQTCGYPFAVDLMGKVDLLGTPIYGVAGCGAGTYRSALVIHKDNVFQSIEDTRNSKLTFNGRNSLSGYHCLKPTIGDPDAWFGALVESGAHRNSARFVAEGRADIAAIDAVCWELLQRYEPQTADQLRILDWTNELPALPFISVKSESVAELALKRTALKTGIDRAIADSAAQPLMIQGIVEIPAEKYQMLKELSVNS